MKTNSYTKKLLAIYGDELSNCTISDLKLLELTNAVKIIPRQSPQSTFRKLISGGKESILSSKQIIAELVENITGDLSDDGLNKVVARLLRYEAKASVGAILHNSSLAKSFLIYEANKYKLNETISDNYNNNRYIFRKFHIPVMIAKHYKEIIIPCLVAGEAAYAINPAHTALEHLLFNVVNTMMIKEFEENTAAIAAQEMKCFDNVIKASLRDLPYSLYLELAGEQEQPKVTGTKPSLTIDPKCPRRRTISIQDEIVYNRPITIAIIVGSFVCSIFAHTPTIFLTTCAAIAGICRLEYLFYTNSSRNDDVPEIKNLSPAIVSIVRRKSYPEPVLSDVEIDRSQSWSVTSDSPTWSAKEHERIFSRRGSAPHGI